MPLDDADAGAAAHSGAAEGGATAPQGFAELLFGASAAEDLALYSPADLAAIAARAFAHLAAPRVASHDIRLLDEAVGGAGTGRDITIVEAINDNRPFLLDSTLAELVERGCEPRLVAHPILDVERDATGRLTRLLGAARAERPDGAGRESLIHIHVERIDGEAERAALAAGLDRVYTEVKRAVTDLAPMRARLGEAVEAYRRGSPPLPGEEVAEAVRFLDWIAADNFTLLGTRDYRFVGGDTADPVEGTGLGILRDPAVRVLRRGRDLVVMTPEIRAFLAKPAALIITKANVKSRVHRRAHLDYIGVKLFGPAGRLAGELRVVGLFTANVYTSSAAAIPYLGSKLTQVVRRAGFDPASYSGRALMHVLDTYPRDELFQIDADTLFSFALAILRLTERPRVRALARPDEFDRFVSVLVFIPKDRYDTEVRRKVGDYLARIYEGRVSAVYPSYPEGPLARTHFIIGRDEGDTPVVEAADLEAGILAIVRTWSDALGGALEAGFPGPQARALAARYGEAFSAAYREAFDAGEALRDIAVIERLADARPRAVAFYRRDRDGESRANLKVFARGGPILLSDRVPLLENFGFGVVNERTYRVVPRGADERERVWLHDMSLERASGRALDLAATGPLVEAALMAVFADLAESDRFNALVLEAGLGWRDAAVMRTLGRYLRQIGIAYGQDYLAATLARFPAIATALLALFYARFDPRREEAGRAAAEADWHGRIETLLKDVSSLDEDRILRRFLNLVEAGVRTNFFQLGRDGMPREAIAIKLACAKVDAIPAPRPLYEIFVHSPRVDGLHLRFGKVARGGLRWSDRPQDFRTEILGLVKAQQVKNAVIVPVGAKGGFIPKRLPPASERQAWLAEGTASYQAFVATLLDLTDDIAGGTVVAPAMTVRRDGDDPYLVVAADKGTASFSDVANGLAIAHGYWLGDAFASGGSQGYDHKKMGITARGAWEAVKRHFREIDRDAQTEPLIVAGIGDMSGDVFGNGMLLSSAMKLVAAFDHRDIFLDPDPDPALSYAQRRRLFDLPRSSWRDYDPALISPGGGVYPRADKSIALSPQARAVLAFEPAEATPDEVIRAILKAPVDLLWFGGIGTYVRAGDETDVAVGDRANDAVRVAGRELRCKVVGEGANLGLTQRGRVEAARRGIKLNTDAIDNSAGVNTSDVEVNIKIALAGPQRDGRLPQAARNALLADMTQEVAGLVLRNNYLQTLAISLTQRRGAGELGYLRRLMGGLEARGRLDRGLEFLPDDIELLARERRGEGLTRPEIAVVLAYAKLALHDALLASSVPDEPYLSRELQRYFPARLRERFPEAVETHRLRREIIATQLANAIVNRGGPTIITRLVDQTGADAPTIAAAYAATRDAYGLVALNSGIDALDGRIGGTAQLNLYGELQDLLLGRITWFIRHIDFARTSLDQVVATYGAGIAAIAASVDEVLPERGRENISARLRLLVKAGLPEDLARPLAALHELTEAPDIVLVAQSTKRSVAEVAATHFAVEGAFQIRDLMRAAGTIVTADHYDRLALDRAVDAIAAAHRKLTAQTVAAGRGAEGVAAWLDGRIGEMARIRDALTEIAASGLTLSKLSVAAGLLGDLARE